MILLTKQQVYGELTITSGPVDENGNYTRQLCYGLVVETEGEETYVTITQGKKFMTIFYLFLATEPSEINAKLAELNLEPPEGWEY